MVLKVFSTFLGVVFGLALLLALLAGGYFLFRYIVGVLGTLEPQLATVAALASVVALLGAMIMAGGLRSRYNREPEAASRNEKAQLYQQLLCASCRWDSSETEHGRDTEVEQLKLKQDLALWGSPEVITAYAEFERLASQTAPQGDSVELLLQKLVMAIRKDLGQATSAIKQHDLLSLLLGKSYR